MPEPPVAGRYRLEHEVGRGGMGGVWLAVDERLGREVALKEVGRLPGESGHDVARALREARSAAALSHPHLVSVYDVVEEPDRAWLVMEYVPGPTLAQLTAEHGPLPADRVARIGAQVAGGLAAAHERGTVHRDVKPGNIMVVTDPAAAGRDVAKVGDFGIARTQGDSQLTRTGLVTGTPAYFSPELARGEEPTPAADVWALGATLFAAVEGRPPYPDQGNALALLATIASQEPPRPSVGGPLGEAITRMLDPDPASRWSMRRAAEALEAAATGGPDDEATLVAAPVDPPTTAFAAQPVQSPVDPPVDPPAEPPAEPSADDRRRPWMVVALVAALLLLVGAFAYASLGDDEQGDTPTAGATPGSRKSESTDRPSSDPAPSGEEPTEPAEEPEEETEGNGAPTTGSRMDFVESYYALLPGDTDTAWTWLSPPMQDQAGGPEGYAGFWGTVESVTVDDTRPSGPDGVEVDLTYVTADGSESETRLIETERTGDGYRIVGDQVVG